MTKKVAVVVPVTSVEIEVTGSEAMLAQSFHALLSKCLMNVTVADLWQCGKIEWMNEGRENRI